MAMIEDCKLEEISISSLSNKKLFDNANLMKFYCDNFLKFDCQNNEDTELLAKVLRRNELLKCEIEKRLLNLNA